MNIVLWILQVLLAAFFLFHGWMYVVEPKAMMESMRQRNPNAQPSGISPGFRVFIGLGEWLGAAGLVLPGLTGILSWLTPLAAGELMFVMANASGYHLGRRETQSAISTFIFFVLLTFVAIMRWQIAPL